MAAASASTLGCGALLRAGPLTASLAASSARRDEHKRARDGTNPVALTPLALEGAAAAAPACGENARRHEGVTLVVMPYPFEITPADISAIRQALETYLVSPRGETMPGWPASLWPLVPELVGEVVTGLDGTLMFPPRTSLDTPSPGATAAFASSPASSGRVRNGVVPTLTCTSAEVWRQK